MALANLMDFSSVGYFFGRSSPMRKSFKLHLSQKWTYFTIKIGKVQGNMCMNKCSMSSVVFNASVSVVSPFFPLWSSLNHFSANPPHPYTLRAQIVIANCPLTLRVDFTFLKHNIRVWWMDLTISLSKYYLNVTRGLSLWSPSSSHYA